MVNMVASQARSKKQVGLIFLELEVQQTMYA